MRRILFQFVVLIAVALAGFGGRVISAQQDKYALQVPNGLRFSDFRGYENWQVVSTSRTDDLFKL